MSSCCHDYPAHDDRWIEAAGFDPVVHPKFVSVEQFISIIYGDLFGNTFETDSIKDVVESLRRNGFANLQRHYTLSERFELYGVMVVEQIGGGTGCYGDYEPKIIKLSNGLTLQEVRDKEVEKAFWASDKAQGYQPGYDFVFCYKVEVASKL